MHDLTSTLTDFCKADAPENMDRLPKPFFIQKSLQGTNLEFILRVGIEGRDILQRNNTVPQSLDFTARETNSIFIAWEAASRALVKGTLDSTAVTQMAEVAPALRAISNYHAQKVSASEQIGRDASCALNAARKEVARAISERDGTKLLELFPYTASLLLDGGKSQVPKHCKDVASLMQRSHMAALLIHKIDTHERTGAAPDSCFGTPKIIRKISEVIMQSKGDAQQNRAVYEGIVDVSDRLDNIFITRRLSRMRNTYLP